MELLPDQQQAY
jgi:hypothetical protein